jgi:hypothetical protein
MLQLLERIYKEESGYFGLGAAALYIQTLIAGILMVPTLLFMFRSKVKEQWRKVKNAIRRKE